VKMKGEGIYSRFEVTGGWVGGVTGAWRLLRGWSAVGGNGGAFGLGDFESFGAKIL
jgi:hypothetical protein